MIDKAHLLNSKQMAEFVARGFLRFDELVPNEINKELCATSTMTPSLAHLLERRSRNAIEALPSERCWTCRKSRGLFRAW